MGSEQNNFQKIDFTVNGKPVSLMVEPNKPLLWVLRDELNLKGTKYGCGLSTCGACTLHLDGQAVRSCVLPVSACQGKEITTVEGLSEDGEHPVQKAWVEAEVPQCGYCQSGQIMQATALLMTNPEPDNATVNQYMSQVLCRCGTYPRIKKAIGLASELIKEKGTSL
ncbi:(2Fe-2S)-binding protein [Aliikangiella sp. G2MR2-5]|uniref:(2Fe-2S)-binding protein n=1 Tax=Aliikangiella sp. G2MR2-5 TaxID=2788943 RepID=UPI0018ABD422|nr:(2Fe-2S)-binding protein [Aliikangiella sp. G2MR2-5]